MKRYRVAVKNEEPICIRSDRADERITTLSYIPGTTFIGALIARFLMENEKDDTFHDFFTRDKIFYPVLYPIDSQAPFIQVNTAIPGVVPLTAQTCKRFGGFKSADPEQHGIYDSLFDWGIYKETQNLEVLLNREECPVCKERFMPASGFYALSQDQKRFAACEPVKQLQTHTGINRQTGTVSESILYNMETIEKSYSFTGTLCIIDADLCMTFLDWIKQIEIRIGAKKTTGMGKCSLEIAALPDATFAAFKERLEAFHRAYKEYKQKTLTGQVQNDDNAFYFAIDLFSETIRVDAFLNYIAGFSGLLVDYEFRQTHLIYEKSRSFEIAGWNNTLGLPRQIETGIEKGSTSLFKSFMDKDELISKLFELEAKGIGIRKTEGFGQIMISNAFHIKGLAGL